MKKLIYTGLILAAAILVFIGCPATPDDTITDPATWVVSYDTNGATGGSVPADSTAYESGAVVTVLGNTGGIERTGRLFIGWNTASDGSGTTYQPGNTFSMGTTDIILYARWISTAGLTAATLTRTAGLLGAAGDNFGSSIAISGDYAIVGAPYNDFLDTDSGAAYIFHRTGTTWDSGTRITASDGEANDRFGFSVAISGDYAVVGANNGDDDDRIIADTGAAYIFHWTGTTWGVGTKITASDSAAGDEFGDSVAISGDYVIVGAPYDDDNGGNSGSAYIFRRTAANTWVEDTKIYALDPDSGDQFGKAVAISGDYALVGASLGDNDDSAIDDTGSAYIFHRITATTWDTGIKLTASTGALNDNFGYSVAISGDYTIVGAYKDDTIVTAAGSAWIFHRTGVNTWDSGKNITAADGAAGDRFGISVAILQDYTIVGAPGDDVNGSYSGSAYMFHRTGTNTWDSGTRFTASNNLADDEFGASVAISGDYTAVGANYSDENGSDAGAACLVNYK